MDELLSKPGGNIPISGNYNEYCQKTFVLPKELSKSIDEYVHSINVTIYTFLIGIIGLVFLNYTKNNSIGVGVTTSGRNADLEGITEMVGIFINTIPIVIRKNYESLSGYLQNLQEDFLAVNDNSLMPLNKIRKVSRLDDSLFRLLFVFKNFPIDESAFTDLDLKVSSALGIERIDQPIGIIAFKRKECLYIRFCYQTRYFNEEQIDKFFEEIRDYATEIQ